MTETLSGVVERVTFHNEENGFCVLRVKTRGARELATVVGHAPSVAPGEFVDAEGAWVQDREHGRQFRSERLRVTPPGTLEGIEKYLASGMIKGIGSHFAARLVAAFGEKVFDVIEREPRRLLEVEGIGPVRQKRITEAWADQKVIREIMVFLQSHGVGTARAVRIYKTYGAHAIDVVRENPYRLAYDIPGIGFKTADQLAARLGIDAGSPQRARAGLAWALQSLGEEGHCAYPTEELLRRARELLGIPDETLRRALEEERAEGRLVEHPVRGRTCVYLAGLFHAEAGVAESLRRLREGPHPLRGADPAEAIARAERQAGLVLSEGQKEAIRRALGSKVLVVTGGPGVGKTTLLNALLRVFTEGGLRCLLAAPTGRAARRLSEATGLEARTIHRLLEVDPVTGEFRRGRSRPLEGDAVILDEASMVDVVLMNQLLRAVPSSATLLVVGDADQLPSVGPGTVLRDLIESGAVPVARLTEIFRQAARSRIVTNAHRINRGLLPVLEPGGDGPRDFFFVEAGEPAEVVEKVVRVVRERIPARFGLDPVRDVQVLTPMNRSEVGARALNERLQRELNRAPGPAVLRFGFAYRRGDKVMQVRNNYDKEVFNGDLGFVTRIDEVERELAVNFDGREVVYDFGELDEVAPAYACSIHKSQGSEYPAVVIPLHLQHYRMLSRNVLYTGVTRGRKLVVLVGSRRALALAVRRTDHAGRISGLRERLAEGRP
jgi:exodeoxyribonuclease V alpha subunit